MIHASAMTQTERLQVMEELWDTICHEGPLPESPAWHEPILSQRSERINSGEAEFITLEALKASRR